MFLSRFSVSARFLLVLVIGCIFQSGISIVSLLEMKHSMIEDRTIEVKHLLETGYSILVFYHDQESKGLMTDVAAREAARDAVRAMHYDGSNYFFIWDLNGKGIAHGSHPEWEGRTFINSPDADKNPVISYMVTRVTEISKSEKKEGYSTFRIQKPGAVATPVDKIAYSRLFEPWGWTIGTGAYVDDIDDTFRHRAIELLGVFTFLIALALIITYVIGSNLARAMKRLSVRVEGVTQGELEGDVPEIERQDEVGVMARALLKLRDTSKEAAELRLEQLRAQETIKNLAFYDSLSHLPNRRLLLDRLQQALTAITRSGHAGALLFIDLDNFKSLNDTLGHYTGDILLRQVAKRLEACIRESDTVARLGGDEFVVMLLNLSEKPVEAAAQTESIGEKILAALSNTYQLDTYTYHCSASIGATLFYDNKQTADELMKQADIAMYQAKKAGRNTLRFFDQKMQETISSRVSLENELQKALENQQLHLHYQIQVDSADHSIGAEALIRWAHPERNLVSPDEFIPLAEEAGLILPIGQWVIETACAQLKAWEQDALTNGLVLSVNVSARQFYQAVFAAQVQATVQRYAINPELLVLEITESILLENIKGVIATMGELKDVGVRISLDDFGTGYSSLQYLKRLPLDQIKIDQSFVRDIAVDNSDKAIVRTIIAMAHSMRLNAIAEGVETAEQRAFLLKEGCTHYQGYLFGKPVPIEQFETLLKQRQSHLIEK